MICSLPPEIQKVIANRLPPSTLILFSRVSKAAYQMAQLSETLSFVSRLARGECTVRHVLQLNGTCISRYRLKCGHSGEEDVVAVAVEHRKKLRTKAIIHIATDTFSTKNLVFKEDETQEGRLCANNIFTWSFSLPGKINFANGRTLWLSKHEVIVNCSYGVMRLFVIDYLKERNLNKDSLLLFHACDVDACFEHTVLWKDEKLVAIVEQEPAKGSSYSVITVNLNDPMPVQKTFVDCCIVQ